MQAGAASLRSRAPALLLPPPGVPNPRTGGLGGGACKRLQAGVARAGMGVRRPPSLPAASAGASNAGPSAPAPSSIPSESNGSSPPPAFNWQQQWYPLVGVGSTALAAAHKPTGRCRANLLWSPFQSARRHAAPSQVTSAQPFLLASAWRCFPSAGITPPARRGRRLKTAAPTAWRRCRVGASQQPARCRWVLAM